MKVPEFIDNRSGNTLSAAIVNHLKALLDAGQGPEELCIATSYFNAAGWLQIAEQAEKLDRVRLLIGVEPNPRLEIEPRQPGDPREPVRTQKLVHNALEQQQHGLEIERDQDFAFGPKEIASLSRLVEFLRSGRIEVRRFENKFFHAKAWLFRGKKNGVLAGSSNLTAAGMVSNLELNLGHQDSAVISEVESWYDSLWEEAAPYDLAALYEALFKDFPPWLIYLRVLWELYGEEVEDEPDQEGRLTLTRFQQHGIWRARRVLEELGGVIVADSVGLGKTFVAGGLMEAYRDRRQRVLLIRPAALEGTWDKFLSDYQLGDVEPISYEKLADDAQFSGSKNNLKRPVDEYQLVVIDEAHNYRNPDAPTRAGVLRQMMRGRKRELVLLTATPVNNSLYDFYHLVSFFIKQDSRLINSGIPSIKALFDEANRIDPGELHPDHLYPLIDATTVKRTRQFIRKHYRDDRIPGPDGEFVPITFPKPIPTTVRYNLEGAIPGFFAEFAEALMPETGEPRLRMARYQVARYLKDPEEDYSQEGALVGLLRSGLLKRFESSAHAFANTCRKMLRQHDLLLAAMDAGKIIHSDFYKDCGTSEDLDEEEFQTLLDNTMASDPLELYDADRLREDLQNDVELLREFVAATEAVTQPTDPKLSALVEELAVLAEQAKTDATSDDAELDNRKVLVFSYFKDTAVWVYEWLAKVIESDDRLACYRGRLAITCGSADHSFVLDSSEAAWGFAPRTAAPAFYDAGDRFDILIATDVLAEGVNLQQCRNIINYDLPWNPMRLIQRHGRIDRLLSQHKRVFLRTFFPDRILDDLLRLEERVRRKLALAAASVGVADAPIEDMTTTDQSFAETREEIERLKNEATDLFEKGGTNSAAQTGEEYRQELRKALQTDLRREITGLPWKAGSGMVRGDRAGYFFCARVGDRVFLRFVPSAAAESSDVVTELGTCLRLIECTQTTERVVTPDSLEGAYVAWSLASESILEYWNYFTDSKNLQPKVRPLNLKVEDFLMEHSPEKVEQTRMDKISNILISPWPRREENKLREVWKQEYESPFEKAYALIEAVESTGIEPFEQPERFPRIDHDEVRLVCWLQIQSE